MLKVSKTFLAIMFYKVSKGATRKQNFLNKKNKKIS
ncbi:hypothetical protein NEOC65_001570 [Neochlamydia sp. AcF65]|nr:hypothetical protein [Neochlamydia sp. AcF65]